MDLTYIEHNFEIINVLNNTGLLYDILINNDESWGENINDWENHFQMLVDGDYFGDDEIDYDTMNISNPMRFMIEYLVEETDNEYKIPCRILYRKYVEWCEIYNEIPISVRKFRPFTSTIGIQRSRCAEERSYIINRKHLLRNIANSI